LDVDDICIGMSDNNRTDPDTLNSFGPYFNLIPLRFRNSRNQTFTETLARAKQKSAIAMEHSRVPFDILLSELNHPISPSHSPLFQTVINYRQDVEQNSSFCGCIIKDVDVDIGATSNDFILEIVNNAHDRPRVSLNAQKSLYSSKNAETLLEDYVRLLDVFSRDPDQAISKQRLPQIDQRNLEVELVKLETTNGIVSTPSVDLQGSGVIPKVETNGVVDLTQEAQLPQEILDSKPHSNNISAFPRPVRVVVLTGATGFLGRALVHELLKHPSIEKIHLIAVRSPASVPSYLKTLRIETHHGDLTSPLLGLDSATAHRVFSEADAIIHSGADRSYLQPYQAIRAANVESTKELIRQSVRYDLSFHHVSTAAMGQLTGKHEFGEVSVSACKPPDGVIGYVSTKWVSEQLLEKASEQAGVRVWLHRPGNIIGDGAPADYIVNSILKFSTLLKTTPMVINPVGHVNLVTAGDIAREIVEEAIHQTAAPTKGKPAFCHHISPKNIPIIDGVRQYLEEQYGEGFGEIPLCEWIEAARGLGLDARVAAYVGTWDKARGRIFPQYMKSSTSPLTPHIPERGFPALQTAIVQGEGGRLYIDRSASISTLDPTQVLVKVVAVSLNPYDMKVGARFPSPEARTGCDFSGTVVALGSLAGRQSSFKIGDRVFGGVHGSNSLDHSSGSFAEFVAIDAVFLLKVPHNVTHETAASIGGVAFLALGLAFYRSLMLKGTPDHPVTDGEVVLVYGGSTSTGTMAIQLLRKSGYRPIATCSPANFELVRSYGAEAVFDYHSPDVAERIHAYTKNSLRYVLDIITEAQSMSHCYAAIGRVGGRYTCLEMYHNHLHTRKTVKPDFVKGWAMFGKRVALDDGYGSEADPEVREFGARWYQILQRLLDEDKLMPHPIRIIPGRWDGILHGLELLKEKRVSAQKLVVRITKDGKESHRDASSNALLDSISSALEAMIPERK
jgi:NADPH:quinone reductase-like Zn-dependent oxidoreductase/nucleoside-diphosphate-sugar epimerase